MKPGELMDHDADRIKKAMAKFAVNTPTGPIPSVKLGPLMRSLNLIPSEAEIEHLVKQLDEGGKGVMNWTKVFNVIVENMPESPNEVVFQIWQAFSVFDKTDKGKVEPSVLRKILLELGSEPLPKKEVDRIVKYFTDPKDNQISYGEIIRLWTS